MFFFLDYSINLWWYPVILNEIKILCTFLPCLKSWRNPVENRKCQIYPWLKLSLLRKFLTFFVLLIEGGPNPFPINVFLSRLKVSPYPLHVWSKILIEMTVNIPLGEGGTKLIVSIPYNLINCIKQQFNSIV